MTRVVCIGECTLELSGGDFSAMRLSFGGDTLNTSVYLARLGVAVDYATALGDDPYSDWMLDEWRAEGIGTELVVRAAGRLPGFYTIRTDDAGERSFHYWRDQAPARDLFSLAEGEAAIERLAGYDWIYLTGVTLSLYSADQQDRLFALLDRARAAGGKVAFDSNCRPRGWDSAGRARAVMTDVLIRTDLAAPTLDNDRQVFGDTDAEACADRLHELGVGEVVVKLDAAGCLVSTADSRCYVPTEEIPQPVDTTGAGDAFNAGYLAARLGGTVIMHPGAVMPRDAMPEKVE